jgi:hypothetical protein
MREGGNEEEDGEEGERERVRKRMRYYTSVVSLVQIARRL